MKKPRKKYKPRDVKPLAALVTLRRAAAAQSTAPLGIEQSARSPSGTAAPCKPW